MSPPWNPPLESILETQENQDPFLNLTITNDDSDGENGAVAGVSLGTTTPRRTSTSSVIRPPLARLNTSFRRSAARTAPHIFRDSFTFEPRLLFQPYANGQGEYIGNVLRILEHPSDTVRTLESVQAGYMRPDTRTRTEIYESSTEKISMSGNLHFLRSCQGNLI